jgi:hypothetical protein
VRLNIGETARFFNAVGLDPDGRVLDVTPFAYVKQFSSLHHNRDGRRLNLRLRNS